VSDPPVLHLFDAVGVEIEYMIVDRERFAVRPVSDELLRAVAGERVSDWDAGDICWSNELVLHVIELKTNGPARDLVEAARSFQREVREIGARLRDTLGARLMPTAMHPLMDPLAETRLWPHEHGPIYAAFDRVFGCRGHGWSNLQSVHINLPFHGDEEFGRLHAAIRLVLPLLPALAASSPFVEGRATGLLDNRMEFYRKNCARFPSVTGEVVPEPVFTRHGYEREILARMYDDVAPHDPEGVLREEFLNARGAIARFDRSAIEIRVIDVGESPRADLAIVAAVVALVRGLVEERWSSLAEQKAQPVEPLAASFRSALREGERTPVASSYARLFGAEGATTIGGIWRRVIDRMFERDEIESEPFEEPLRLVLEAGPLARRLVAAVGGTPDARRIGAVYARLCDVLEAGELFR